MKKGRRQSNKSNGKAKRVCGTKIWFYKKYVRQKILHANKKEPEQK